MAARLRAAEKEAAAAAGPHGDMGMYAAGLGDAGAGSALGGGGGGGAARSLVHHGSFDDGK